MEDEFKINKKTAKDWTESKITEHLKKTELKINEKTIIDKDFVLKIYNDSILGFDYKKKSKYYWIVQHIKENGYKKEYLENIFLSITEEYLEKLKIKTLKKQRLEQMLQLLKNWFENNPDQWLRTSQTKKLLDEFLKQDYEQVETRHNVYSIMAKIRKEFRNKKFKDGYIISGRSILKTMDLDNNDDEFEKVDGWYFTKDKSKVELYLTEVINQANKIIYNYTKFKEIFEENTSD